MKNKKTLIYDDACPLCAWYAFGTKKWVNCPLKKLYNFISYNRKVIVARKAEEGKIDCSPDFNVFYRFLFMGVFLCFNTLMLFPLYENLVSKTPMAEISLTGLHAAHAAIVFINCLLALTLSSRQAIEYLGQVNMLALITNLLLLPLMLMNKWWPAISDYNFIYLLLLFAFVVKEYFRRMDYAGIVKKHKAIVALNLLSMAAFAASIFVF